MPALLAKFQAVAPFTCPCASPHDLVPTPAQETNILKSFDSQMRMNRAALLAFQHCHVGHWITRTGQHTMQPFQIGQHSFSIFHIVAMGESDQMVRPDRQAFPSDLSFCPCLCPLFILFFIS